VAGTDEKVGANVVAFNEKGACRLHNAGEACRDRPILHVNLLDAEPSNAVGVPLKPNAVAPIHLKLGGLKAVLGDVDIVLLGFSAHKKKGFVGSGLEARAICGCNELVHTNGLQRHYPSRTLGSLEGGREWGSIKGDSGNQ
jgi:hypothetical protein